MKTKTKSQPAFSLSRDPYPTDLTDAQWALIEPLIPAAKPGGPPRTVDMREVVNAVFYILKAGCDWRMMPHDLPAWKTVYDYFTQWRDHGTWKKIHDELRGRVRQQAGKKVQPTAGILDSQSVKTAEKGGFVGMMLVKR